jgi:hypothetical protein
MADEIGGNLPVLVGWPTCWCGLHAGVAYMLVEHVSCSTA